MTGCRTRASCSRRLWHGSYTVLSGRWLGCLSLTLSARVVYRKYRRVVVGSRGCVDGSACQHVRMANMARWRSSAAKERCVWVLYNTTQPTCVLALQSLRMQADQTLVHARRRACRRGDGFSIQVQLGIEESPSSCLLYTVAEAKVSPTVLTLSASIEWVAAVRSSTGRVIDCHPTGHSAPDPLSGSPGFRKSGLASVYTRASRPPNCVLRLSRPHASLGPEAGRL
ncbi:hypothetical protein QBC45DRAFT_66076 [Copromyces sp. CBS 386.78]|nr:hypothetical protein QBC45DRAFT_66076 [Copromyces sp. CBS 386.78]